MGYVILMLISTGGLCATFLSFDVIEFGIFCSPEDTDALFTLCWHSTL